MNGDPYYARLSPGQWVFRREFQDLVHSRPDIERTMAYHRTLGNPQEKLCLEMVLSVAMLTRARVHKTEPAKQQMHLWGGC